jgi:hypothetical protein
MLGSSRIYSTPHQAAADLGGQPDALGLAPRQRRSRAVQRQVVQAHVDQERQALADLAQDPFGHQAVAAREVEAHHEVGAVLDGHARDVDDGLAAHLHVAGLHPQPAALALLAGRLGHVPVELVVDGLEVLVGGAALLAPAPLVLVEAALQVGQHPLELFLERVLAPVLVEDELHLLGPRALQDQLAVFVRQLLPGGGQVDLEVGGHRLQHLLEEAGVAPFPGLDHPVAQRQIPVGDDEVGVEEHARPDAVAGRAGPGRVVEREQTRGDLREGGAAGGAGELLGEQDVVALEGGDLHQPVAQLGRQLDGVSQPLADAVLVHQAVDEHLDCVRRLGVQLGRRRQLRQLAVDGGAHVAVLAQAGQLGLEVPLLVADDRRQHRKARPLGEGQHLVHHLLDGVRGDGLAAAPALHVAHPRPEQAHVIVDLRDGADAGARVARSGLLLDGDGGGQPVDGIDVGLAHLLEELAGVGGQGLDVTALPFGVDGVEGQRGLARPGHTGDDHQLVARDLHVDVLEVVSARPFDDYLFHPLPSASPGPCRCPTGKKPEDPSCTLTHLPTSDM